MVSKSDAGQPGTLAVNAPGVSRADPESTYEVLSPHTSMPQHDVFRFGNFELLPESGELRKAGVKIRLQGKPLQVLKALIERPGKVVTREELRECLWTADTFVDFESGLNTAANRLRNALGDSAERPIYIETLPRIGYRFIAPVTRVRFAAAAAHAAEAEITAPSMQSALKLASAEVRPRVKEQPQQQPEGSEEPSRWVWIAAAMLAMLGVAGIAVWRYIVISKRAAADNATFQRVTLQSGNITGARFTPDGKRIIYSAAWGDEASHLFATEGLGPAARDLGYGEARLESVSPSGSLTFWSRPSPASNMILSEVNAIGGEVHTLGRTYWAADYGPNGALCFVKREESGASIEFPPGHEIYRTSGWISNARVSPHGNEVAFISHPLPSDDAGDVMVAGTDGKSKVLSPGWGSAVGLSWNAAGDEVWFTAARSGTSHELMATDRFGHTRRIARTAGSYELEDATHAGAVLVVHNTERLAMTLADLRGGTVKNVSRFDWSRPVAMSGDAANILFDESGEGGGRRYAVYLYSLNSAGFTRLGDGRAMDLSADGEWALTQDVDDGSKLTLISTKTRKAATVSGRGLIYHWARFLPGNREILVSGSFAGKPAAVYRQTLPDGTPALIDTLPDFSRPVIDRTGTELVSWVNDKLVLIHLDTGKVDPIHVSERVSPVAVLGPRQILVRTPDRGHLNLDILDSSTGKLRSYRRITDPGAVNEMVPVSISSDFRVAVYMHPSTQSELFVVKGWS